MCLANGKELQAIMITGSEACPSWKPGAKLNRGGRIGEILDEGRYHATDSYGLWFFTVRWADGSEASVAPLVGDCIQGRPKDTK